MWMRVSGGGGLLKGPLTHPPQFARRTPRTFHYSPRHFPLLTHPTPSLLFARMASDTSRPEWTAPRVRETFLEYFKQNGHTFGA
jgi:alanyl-tRNA synthetase